MKKYFDWTPRDIAQWEAIRERGLWHFLLWYGLLVSGGVIFVIPAAAVLFNWVRLNTGVDNHPGLAALALQLAFMAAVCVLGGLVNGLVTWVVEERLYQKYIR